MAIIGMCILKSDTYICIQLFIRWFGGVFVPLPHICSFSIFYVIINNIYMYQFQSDIHNVIVCAVWKILKIISSTWWTIWTAFHFHKFWKIYFYDFIFRSACTVIWWNYALQLLLCSTDTLSSLFSASGPFVLQNSTKVSVFWCLSAFISVCCQLYCACTVHVPISKRHTLYVQFEKSWKL
jgi:hypothetical protein